MKQKFTHLHVHTDASLRDGMGPVRAMIAHAKGLGFDTLAMTDHGTLANAVTFTIEAQEAGIKPIMGMEGYIEYDGTIGHITLLADGEKGWHSLVTLNNKAQESGHRSPAFRIDDLVKHADGLVCLTGCIASPFQQMTPDDAYRLGLRLKSAFGQRLFSELMFVGDSLAWERPLQLASRLHIKPVITNDVHFTQKTHQSIHPILTKMKAGFSYDSHELYLKTREEMLRAATRFGLSKEDANEYLDRAHNIGRIVRPVELRAEPHLPTTEGETSLQKRVLSGPRASLLADEEYLKRVRHEAKIVHDMGYEDYFIILDNILQNARNKGVKIGPGRGSGAGSLILYLLGITDVDPIKYGLQFERFLNPERRGMPDVDVDIDSERRDEVLAYAADKYGAVPIATYSRYSHKSLVRDLGKMFKFDQKLIDLIADGDDMSESFMDAVRIEPNFATAYEVLLGQIRHKGKHAGGVIITDTLVPLERVGDTLAAGWSEGRRNELSYAGVVKFDLLGLSVLSALSRLEKMHGVTPDAPEDGSAVFSIFQRGDVSGIFQFSGSDGIRRLTMDVKPDTFEDLVAINALFRPGAIDSGSMTKFVEWKKKPRKVAAYIADVLAPTYGAIVYQEQVMEIYRRTVNGSLGEADMARRVIAKGALKSEDPDWLRKFAALQATFIDGAVKRHGMKPEAAKELWDELATHVRYSFNKSHATAYSMLAWECAWWKYHYPVSFYATMLNVDKENEQAYIINALQAGVTIKPPHINRSGTSWVADEDEKIIFMPLATVKFMGPSGVAALVEEREKFGPFVNYEEYMERVPKARVKKNAREGLYAIGGFDGLDGDEAALELNLPLETVGRTQIERKYLGYVVPTRKMLETFEKYERLGYICGIIDSSETRTSKWGEYAVYRISPSGIFWTRDVMDLEEGTVVAVMMGVKGKAKEIKLL